MSVWGADEADALAAAPSYVKPPRAPAKFSAWSALPRGVAEAGAQVGASVADVVGGFGQVAGAYPELLGAIPDATQRKQADKARAKLLGDGIELDLGNPAREWGRAMRPDAQDASTAEQLIYGFARGAAKVVAGAVVAGPAGVVAAGAEEGMSAADDLKQQGVGFDARVKAGAVQGAGLALAALPAAGTTLKSTAALYLAGGPGGYMAQQALTREILRNAGHDKLAEQYDPFDPVGLAVSSLIPAGFAAYGLRANKLRAADPVITEQVGGSTITAPKSVIDAAKKDQAARDGIIDVQATEVPPSEPTAIASAAREAMPREVVDAAHVSYLAERRAAAHVGNAADEAAHETALGKAEAQMARGEPVNVLDVAPRGITPAERDANFRAWFGDSKVVDKQGQPIVMFRGTANADASAYPGGMVYLSPDPAFASMYAASKDGGAVFPLYVKAENVIDPSRGVGLDLWKSFQQERGNAWYYGTTGTDRGALPEWTQVHDFQQWLAKNGVQYDGLWLAESNGKASLAVRDVSQLKSAIGNSGRFDPNSPSLTDPITELAQAVDQLRRAMQEPESAPTRPQAPQPQAAAAPRVAGEGAAAPDQGRPAGTVEAAGVTPGAKAETTAAQARVAEVQAEMPDLMVMLDGMERPMPLSEFMAAVKAEADEMTADAPLVETLAQCAILNG